MKKEISIIGSGFSSLSASCYLAKHGFSVNVYEKNETAGGRAREFFKEGFRFDMGPSWYWMPDVFDQFFSDFGKKTEDYYKLTRLDPSYRIYFDSNDFVDLPTEMDDLIELFEGIERGSGKKLKKFLNDAEFNYEVAMNKIVQLPGLRMTELITKETVLKSSQFLRSISKSIRKWFKNERLIQILEFPVLFLGAKPSNTPYFYCFMNHADLKLGTWYPEHGMHSVVKAMYNLAIELGVKFHFNANVSAINVENDEVVSIDVNSKPIPTNFVLSGADYVFTESLLQPTYRNYTDRYWQERVFAPSSLLFYIGFDCKVENVLHHTLFFDADFDQHAKDIYDNPVWPKSPLFYANFTSKTSQKDAPEGSESCFLLVPIAPGIDDSEEIREDYFNLILKRLESSISQELSSHIVFKKSFCVKDFIDEYNSFKGNAYGLANTLRQTGFMKPKLINHKLSNLFYTGQLTVPGPGVPPAIISGKIVSKLINEKL